MLRHTLIVLALVSTMVELPPPQDASPRPEIAMACSDGRPCPAGWHCDPDTGRCIFVRASGDIGDDRTQFGSDVGACWEVEE